MIKKLLILLALILNILFINNTFGNNINKGCLGPIYTPFDSIILFYKFDASNSPSIKDYNLDENKKEKLNNILSKIPDDRKAIFLINIEKIFKDKLDLYSKNLKGYTKGGMKYYSENEIGKIKLLYSLNFYFSKEYNKYDKSKETIIVNDELSLENGTILKIVKSSNEFIQKINCIQIYDGNNNIFESNDYNKDLSFDIKLVNNNIFYITYKKVGNSLLNKNLIKIYNIGLGKLTTQQPLYVKIIDIAENKTIINKIISDYIGKLKL